MRISQGAQQPRDRGIHMVEFGRLLFLAPRVAQVETTGIDTGVLQPPNHHRSLDHVYLDWVRTMGRVDAFNMGSRVN